MTASIEELKELAELAREQGNSELEQTVLLRIIAAQSEANIPSGRGIYGKQRKKTREELLSELPPERRELIKSITPAESALIGMGRGFSDVLRGVGLMDQADQTEKEAFAQLEQQQPLATAGQIAGQAAPFVPFGIGAGGIAATAPRVAATAGLGAAEGGIIARGEGRDLGAQLLSAGIGGTVAGALELGLPVIGRLGGKVIRRVTGRAPKGAVVDAMGNPSDELLNALQAEGLDFDDLVRESTKDLQRQAVDPEQAARKAFLESQGLVGDAAPTRAQITRSVDDFSIQQEAMKSSGKVEQRIAAQDRVLTTRFDDAIAETAGDPFSPVSSVTESLLRKANTLDAEIGRLYKEARKLAPGDKVVRFDKLSNKLRELAPLDQRSGGNVRAIVGTLKAKGLIDDNLKPTGRISVEQTETQIRQFINDLYDESVSGGDIKNSVLRQMKDALDDDVFSAAGDDLFKQARKAKASFERDLSRAKISKFDKRKKNLVRDMLENRDSVNPENFTNNVVFSKSWRSTDLQQLKDYITTEPHGMAAWNDLRADVLQKIKEKSFIGPEDAQGFKSLSRDKIGKALASIGDNKLNILFDKNEVNFLHNMRKVAQFREPRKMTAQGYGPSAKAIIGLEKKLVNMPVFGHVFGFFDMDAAGRLATRSKMTRIKPPIEGSVIITPVAIAGGAAAAQTQAGEE